MLSLTIAIVVLASWRISRALANDSEAGPFEILHRIRYFMGVRYDNDGAPIAQNQWAEMILCMWCNSFWVGAAMAVIVYVWPDVVWLLLPFSISAVVVWMERIFDKLE